MINLVELFHGLATPSAETSALRFVALRIPGFEQHHLGKDAHGGPALLVATDVAPMYGWPAPVVLEHLSVQHDIGCRVSKPDGPIEEGQFTVVRCTAGDAILQDYFLHVAAAVVALLGPRPSHEDVTAAIDRLVELFRAISLPARKSLQGLWGELFLIARAREPAALTNAWHALTRDRYDFSAGPQRVEVKTASGRIRQHYFSLDQLLPVPGTELLIASVLVEPAGAGASVIDLIAEIRGHLGDVPNLLLHLDRVVGLTLGNSLRHASEERFDRHLAERSLTFFEPDVVPKVDPILPPGVSDVRFRVDLTNVPSADFERYRSGGGLFFSALRG